MAKDQERSHPHTHLSKTEIAELLDPVLPKIDSAQLIDEGTGGGNTHYQIEAEGGPYILRLYIRYPEAVTREEQIHTALKGSPFIPKLLYTKQSPPLALFHKHPGKRLSEVPWPDNLSYTLGQALATIHSITYPWASLCTQGLAPDNAFGEEKNPYYKEAFRLLTENERVSERLGPNLVERALRWMEKEESAFPKLERRSHLVHSDFRPENLLYDAKEGLCVLDWEFAHVGNPLLDLGILLRHEHCHPLNVKELEKGYADGGETLPAEWEKSAALGDLVNIAQVLSRPVELPKMCAFLIDVLKRRLD